ncbi:hypothetical protein OOU_Y34scaffold00075g1 [Pyricularia oryzae Y34]|uniref:Uncharacterized protein n=1 Tax=Pyricularia oryzae (strain Y34) TaxID=1143189 RepID=A0AA97P9G5_PYRO3|nr:hypothetical protein OOU_Y34scaffold00075g1 [Pyricularia oryzae Y34]
MAGRANTGEVCRLSSGSWVGRSCRSFRVRAADRADVSVRSLQASVEVGGCRESGKRSDWTLSPA